MVSTARLCGGLEDVLQYFSPQMSGKSNRTLGRVLKLKESG